MATIGLSEIYYAPITEGTNGDETYGTPAVLGKGISAGITVESAEASLYAADGLSEEVKEFKRGTISLNVADIGSAVAAALVGVTIDSNKVIVSTAEDNVPYVAIGFKARRSNGTYRYFWLYRVKFGIPSVNLTTKGDSITFNTPTIEGTIMRRNKADAAGKHPWKTEASEGDTGLATSTLTGWFSAVYEPSYPSQ